MKEAIDKVSGLLSNSYLFEDVYDFFTRILSGFIFLVTILIIQGVIKISNIFPLLNELSKTQFNIILTIVILFSLYILSELAECICDAFIFEIYDYIALAAYKWKKSKYKIISKLGNYLYKIFFVNLIPDPLYDFNEEHKESAYEKHIRFKLNEYFKTDADTNELVRLCTVNNLKNESVNTRYRYTHTLVCLKTLMVCVLLIAVFIHFNSIIYNILLVYVLHNLFKQYVSTIDNRWERVLDSTYLKAIEKEDK